ncbi:Hsp70 family protein [Rhodococcus cercidiphylli]|uniref:Hsp70 family protein n=1 Tax=Rhodococcus cercidiphylli TaxID=489916 RepID=A0ABU4AW41_9NOCA|nr:Hsp70 family protein [Rhodococcus cercidiphylli]MDV6230460.1 Hsp70 family protein [Rhodococcus cercidiphylli]
MTVLLGVSMGTRAVRTAQPRAEQFGSPVGDPSGLVTDIDRPLFFRNELIDSVGGDLPHLAAESIGAAAESEPELATGVAYRDPRQADALHAALSGARLHNYHLVPEVEAVVEYLAATGEARNCNSVALFDLGSSGLTVSVVDLVQRTVIASQRSGAYSGDLLDAYVRNNQLQRLGKQPTDPDMALFEKRCRIAKERLSTQDAVCLPDASGMILLSRENFELLITDLLDEAIEFARDVMIGANVPIDAVVLIGGGARMPIVQKRVGPLLELPSIVPTEPETVAARGAALAARPHSRTRTGTRRAPNRPVTSASMTAEPTSRVRSEPASVPVPPPLPAPVRPVPANAESQHAAPGVPVSAPSPTRPVPARPWIAAAAVGAHSQDTVSEVPVSEVPVSEMPASEVPADPTGTSGEFASSRFTDSAESGAVDSVPETSPVVEDVLDDHVQGARVDGEVVALSANTGDSSAEISAAKNSAARPEAADDGKPVPFQLKNVYWLDADYDDDDGEDDRTRARRKLRTGGVLALGLALVVGGSAFMITQQNTPQVVDTSVSRNQTEAPAVTTTVPPTSVTPAPVLPPPAPAPETTVEPTTVPPETEVYQEPWTPEPTTTTAEPAPLPPVETVPPTTQQPPPLIPGFPEFTLPGFPPIAPPAP